MSGDEDPFDPRNDAGNGPVLVLGMIMGYVMALLMRGLELLQ